MATLINRKSRPRKTPVGSVEVTAFRSYPDSAGFVRISFPGDDRPGIVIQLRADEADIVARGLSRSKE